MLSQKDRIRIMNEFNQENSLTDVKIGEKEFNRAQDIYNRAITENRWQGVDAQSDESLFSGILGRIAANIPDSEIFISFSDNKHMAFFNNFGADGLADKLIDALKSHGISTDVLKGVQRGNKFHDKDEVSNDGVRVQLMWGQDDEGYYYIDTIYITRENANGETETIFEWHSEGVIDEDSGEFVQLDTWTHVDRDEFSAGNTTAYKDFSTPDYSYREERYKTTSGKDATRKRYAAGTVINGVKVGGRFFK